MLGSPQEAEGRPPNDGGDDDVTEKFTVADAVAALARHSQWTDDRGEIAASLMPMTSAIPGTFEATDTLGQFVLRLDDDRIVVPEKERPTTRFVVRIERMD